MEIETGGSKTRYQWMIEAIKTLKQIEKEERNEQMMSRKYFHSMQDGVESRKCLTKRMIYGEGSIKN